MVRGDFEWAVPLGLPPRHIGLLKGIFASCLEGLERDLRSGHRLREPEQARDECSALTRLLNGLSQGIVLGPDEAAYEVLKRLAAAADSANGYTAVLADHDALHGLLAGLEATFPRTLKRSASRMGRRAVHLAQLHRPPSGGGVQRVCAAPLSDAHETLELQLRVLGVILREHPQQLTYREIAERIFDDLDEPDAGAPFAYAIRDLSLGGLAKPQGPLVLPTKAALHIKRLDLCK